MKYKIRIFDGEHIMRNMLLNINAHSVVKPEDYNISLESFNGYVKSLIENGIVRCECDLPITNSEKLQIKDIKKFDEWKSFNYRKQLNYLQQYVAAALAFAPIIAEIISKFCN